MKKSKMPVRKWSAGRGTLWVISTMFIASAAIRFGTGAGPAIAQEIAARDTMVRSDGMAPENQYPAEITALLADLAGRGEYLDTRERRLDELSQTLSVAEIQVRRQLDALVTAEAKLAATIATSETAAESDLARLTAVYENMKPKQASTLFEEMQPEFAAGFVGRMRPDAAAKILAGLSPQAAYTISVILAGRNAGAPTE